MQALVSYFWFAIAHAVILAHVTETLDVACECFGVVPMTLTVKGHVLTILSASSVFVDGIAHKNLSSACHTIALDTLPSDPAKLRVSLACVVSAL